MVHTSGPTARNQARRCTRCAFSPPSSTARTLHGSGLRRRPIDSVHMCQNAVGKATTVPACRSSRAWNSSSGATGSAPRSTSAAPAQSAGKISATELSNDQEAVPPPPGISRWGGPEPPVPQPRYTPSPHLLFAALAGADGHLLFLCENHITPPPPDGEPVVV